MGRRASPLSLRLSTLKAFDFAFYQEIHYTDVFFKALSSQKMIAGSLQKLGFAPGKLVSNYSFGHQNSTVFTYDTASLLSSFVSKSKNSKHNPIEKQADGGFPLCQRTVLFSHYGSKILFNYLNLIQQKYPFLALEEKTYLLPGYYSLNKNDSIQCLHLKNPKLSAAFIVDILKRWVEKHPKKIGFLLNSLSRTLDKADILKLQGYKILCSGRIGGVEKAKCLVKQKGQLYLQSFHHKIDYAFQVAHTVHGCIGLKVWLSFRAEC